MVNKYFQFIMISFVLVGLLAGGGVTTVAGQVLPPINDPLPGSTLTTTTVTFTGGLANQAGEQHWLSIETSPYANDIFHQSLGTGSVATVGGLPTSGTLYVRYHTYTTVAGWDSQAHTYTMNVSGGSSGNNTTAEILAQIAVLNNKLDILKQDVLGVVQNWDRKLDSTNGKANGCNSDRFICLWPTTDHPDGAVVRDNETGLLWERSPGTSTGSWHTAIEDCAFRREVGGRKGWHLPMREQLASLIDINNEEPALPKEHPFQNVQSDFYWTATTNDSFPSFAVDVWFKNGNVGNGLSKDTSLRTWCVRGGQSYDGQDVRHAVPAS